MLKSFKSQSGQVPAIKPPEHSEIMAVCKFLESRTSADVASPEAYRAGSTAIKDLHAVLRVRDFKWFPDGSLLGAAEKNANAAIAKMETRARLGGGGDIEKFAPGLGLAAKHAKSGDYDSASACLIAVIARIRSNLMPQTDSPTLAEASFK